MVVRRRREREREKRKKEVDVRSSRWDANAGIREDNTFDPSQQLEVGIVSPWSLRQNLQDFHLIVR